MFKSTGTIRYSPKADSIPQAKWWMVVNCCEDLSRYYRDMYLLDLYKFRGLGKLMKPAWGSHISVIANEQPPLSEFWQSNDGQTVEFEYESEIKTNGEYFWLSVYCDELLDWRQSLGLTRDPFYPLHLTIGRVNDNRGTKDSKVAVQ